MVKSKNGSFASSTPPPRSSVLDVDRRSSIDDVPHVVLNKVAEYSDIPECIRLRQVNSTLRDGVPPTVPPWHCAFTEDAILDDCDDFWSKIAEIMAWFLIITHNRVTEEDSIVHGPTVCFRINRNLQDGLIADNRTLHPSFWLKERVYTPSKRQEGLVTQGPPENPPDQWMVENHEDYYQGCVMQMIQQWRKRLSEGLSAKDSGNLKGSADDITMSLSVEQSIMGYMRHVDAINYIGKYIAEELGRMYGLQIYYYWDRYDVGISIAGREPRYFHFVTPVAAPLPDVRMGQWVWR